MSKTIYTIDSRDNTMLEVMKQYFKLSDLQMSKEINNMHDILVEQLEKKGISYSALKSVLVPQKKRHEILLVFDTSQIEDEWYGIACHNAVIRLLDKSESHSFLCGDYISKINTSQENANYLLYRNLSEHIDLSKIEFKSSEQLFFIYINNVSDRFIDRLRNGLLNFQGFVGIVDVTLSSVLKIYTSSILTNGFIQYHDLILQPSSEHDDSFNVEDKNELGYDFAANGFKVRCIYTDLFGLFLTYKIERLYFNILDTSDQAMAINSITPVFQRLNTSHIIVTPEKLEYLKQNKGDTMKRIGLSDITPEYLAQKIKENINSNYLFCMEFNDVYQIAKFNIILEINSYKIQLGLKYDYANNTLSLITMY